MLERANSPNNRLYDFSQKKIPFKALQVVLPTLNLLCPNGQVFQGNFFMPSDTVVMSLHMRAALFLGGEDIREDKECADSFSKSDWETMWDVRNGHT